MKKHFLGSKNGGFTLIELLVVIAIIGTLSSIVYVSLGQGRAAARDEVRKTTLKEMQLAIELYKAQNGRYPSACGDSTNWQGNVPGSYGCGSNYIIGLVPDYIPELPVDPKTTGNSGYLYRVNTNGTAFKLLANNVVEVKTVSSYDDEFARCPRLNPSGTGTCTTAAPPAATYGVFGGTASEYW